MLHSNLTLSRFFSNGPPIVVAIDHGMFDGPIKGFENVRSLPKSILPEIDGVLMSPGTLSDIGLAVCGRRSAPMAITRLNWSTIYCFEWDYHSGETVPACAPRQAMGLGTSMVLVSLSLCTRDEGRDARNVALFSKLCNDAHALGLPVVGEYFPVNPDTLSDEELGREIKSGCRILYELGADVIKTFYTKNFSDIVSGCPAPILSLGGKRLASDLEVLQCAQQQIRSGAAGIVFGRNVIQSEKPLELQKALMSVVKNKVEAREAAERFGVH